MYWKLVIGLTIRTRDGPRTLFRGRISLFVYFVFTSTVPDKDKFPWRLHSVCADESVERDQAEAPVRRFII